MKCRRCRWRWLNNRRGRNRRHDAHFRLIPRRWLLLGRQRRLLLLLLLMVMLMLMVVVMRRVHQRPRRLSLLEQSESAVRRLVVVARGFAGWWRSFAQLGHQTHVLLVDLVRTRHDARLLRTTVLGDVACTAANGAQNIVRHIRLVRTQPALVLRRAAVVAPRCIRLPQRAVQLRQFPQLHSPQIVVTLRHLDALLDHVLDAVHRLLHRFRVAGRDERVQWLVLAGQRLSVLATHFAFLHRALAADDDLCARVLLHRFQRVAARPNQQSNEVNVRVLLLRNQHLVTDADHRRSREEVN